VNTHGESHDRRRSLMPRCGCASDQCSCFIIAGENVQVSGGGTRDNPYVVSAEPPTIITSPGSGGGWEAGDIKESGRATPSDGWLACNGQAVSRAVYSTLFAAIGTFYGAGDGSTTFNVPNKQDKVSVGVSGSKPRGATGGAATKVLTAANLPAHVHSMDHTHAATSSSGLHDHELSRHTSTGTGLATIPRGQAAVETVSRNAIGDDGAHTHTIPSYTGNTGNGPGTGTAVDIMPPYVATNFFIKT
jgi:microcystin-dependent protein